MHGDELHGSGIPYWANRSEHDAALLAAEENGNLSNWTNVYNLTSRQVTAQYLPADFQTLFNQQVASVGKITSISTPVTSPVAEFTPEGQAYFAVTQTVKIQHSGVTHTRTLTSYYILENGTWLFWFTASGLRLHCSPAIAWP